MAPERPALRPGQSSSRQRTLSTLQPQGTRESANGGGSISGRDDPYSLSGRSRGPDISYSLAGRPREPGARPPPRHGTYVADGYRQLNPQYESAVHDPVFSLAGNQPHTVRGFMKRHPSTGKKRPVGTGGTTKGETEPPPQFQNIDERNGSRNRTGGGGGPPGTPDTQQQTPSGQEDNPYESPGIQGGDITRRTQTAHDQDGQPLGTIGEEVQYMPHGNDYGQVSNDSEETLAQEQEQQPANHPPFNPWAGFRRKWQDPLGEWLGTTILMAIGVGSNLQVATSQDQSGTAQTMFWAWGFGTMVAIYVSGGSSGAHLNPAISIMLSAWRGFPARRVPTYILAQLLGAFTGALIAIALYRDAILHLDGALIPSSTGTSIYTQPKDWVRPATAFFTEAFGTGLLSLGIVALGDDSNSPPGAGMHAFIIGLLVSVLLMAFEANTGATFNPVRDLGPRLAAMTMGYPSSIFNAADAWWIWGGWGATITGSLLGVAVYDVCIFKGGESPVNYSTAKWRREGLKAEAGWFNFVGERGRARDIDRKLEAGEA